MTRLTGDRRFYDPHPGSPGAGGAGLHDSWDVLLACVNGHLINDRSRGDPARNASHCSVCGAETLSACAGCQEPIPGFHYRPAEPSVRGTQPAGESRGVIPQYCDSCGRPFPWTERAMSAARAVIREFAALDQYERDQLRRSIDDIIRETPQTPVAVLRINRALSRIGGETADTLRELLIGVASEAVKPRLRRGASL